MDDNSRKTRELQTATSQTLGYLITDIFIFCACIVVAFVYSFKLTLVMMATGVPSAIILWGLSHFLDPAIEAQKRELSQAAKHLTAATTAIDLVKVYNGADHEAFQYISAIRRSTKYHVRQVICNCGQMSYIKLWMIMLFVLGFYFAIVQVDQGELKAGDALTTFYTALIAFQSVGNLVPHWLVLVKGMVAGQSLQALVEGESGQVDKDTDQQKPSKCEGEIKMTDVSISRLWLMKCADNEQVSFAYPSNPSNVVLKPSSLQFEPGQLTFVVGRSGSGKSTLGSLLVRFYEPLTGQIIIDGNSIPTLDVNWLRQNITLIQQSSTLFNDTFSQNVAFGAPDPDNVSQETIVQACNMALLQFTILSMPEGVKAMVGPTGYSLSGGQKQRLALARAKLRDPPVLILDEITGGLDPVNRHLIMEALRIWRKGKTTIVITHEVGYIEEDEYVYVLADGSVVQHGLRKEISTDESGLFASLVASADAMDDSASTDSESEIETSVDDEPVHEVQYANIIRSAIVDNRGMSVGLYRRLSLGGELAGGSVRRTSSCRASFHQIPTPKDSDGLVTEKNTVERTGSGRFGRTPSMRALSKRGLNVQRSRTSNARQTLQKELDVESFTSLNLLENFFLENLSKSKKKEDPSKACRLPPMSAILKTVWPALDNVGKAQLILGILLCFVIAASTPIFSYLFSNLLAQFWVTADPRRDPGKWAGLLVLVAIIDSASTFFGHFLMECTAQKWINALRTEAIKRILSQPKSWFDKPSHSPSRITQCLDRNAEEMGKLVGMFVPIMLTVTCMISTSLIWALVLKWDLTLVTLAGIPVSILAARANSLVSDKWEAICKDAAASTSAIFSETFSNIKVIRALTLERYFANKYIQSAASTYRMGVKRGGYVGLFYGLHISIVYFLAALIFYYAAKTLSDGSIDATTVVRVVNLLIFSLATCVGMLSNVPQIAAAKTTAVQMLYYANLSHTASHESHGDKRLTNPLPVRMTNLRFAYPGAKRTQVLRNINLDIEAGTCTAIAGAKKAAENERQREGAREEALRRLQREDKADQADLEGEVSEGKDLKDEVAEDKVSKTRVYG
ncbi:ATP-dependent permease [Collariella sp. IMI 366227]|nr:ATP-dependent permease [Collariella sp. IMI 366227]